MASSTRKRRNKQQTLLRIVAIFLAFLMLLSVLGALLNFF